MITSNHQKQQISKREKEVLYRVSLGETIKEIAGNLYLSDHTVVSHQKNIKRKLGARNISHMIRIAFDLGLLRAKPDFKEQNYLNQRLYFN